MGSPHEPYWRANTSFSPPPARWDFRFQYEGRSFGSQEGSRLYGSSTSSNSRESRSWFRGNHLPNYQHSGSDRVGTFFSSPSDLSPAQQWTPPVIQEISLDDYDNSSKRVSDWLSVSPTSKELFVSSNSDSSDYDITAKSSSSRHNFSGHRCLITKPVHPLAFPLERNSPGFQDFNDTFRQRDRVSTASCDFEFSDVSEPIHSDSLIRSTVDKCGLCDRFLSRRSPWSCGRGDMPVTGVLSCRHVFHTECLDQTTPKTYTADPPCPICAKFVTKNSPGQWVSSKSKNGFRVSHGEDGPWGCDLAGNCVEGALSAPSRHPMSLINRNRIKESRSLKGNLGMDFGDKQKKSGTQSDDGDGVGCSTSASGSRKKS